MVGYVDESYIRRNEEEIYFPRLIYALVYKGMEMCNVVIGQWLVTTFLSKS